MPKLVVNGVGTNYLQVGEGPDLVMIHGLAANLAFWYMRIVPELARHFRVTVYDLRGHGLSDMPPSGYTTLEMARDLTGLLDALNIGPCDLVGHSYGAAVALHYTILHPHRAKSLSLFDCRVNSLQPIRSLGDHEYWEKRRAELERDGLHIPDGTPRILYDLLVDLAPLSRSGKAVPATMPGMSDRGSSWNPNSRAGRRWAKLVETTTLAEDIRQSSGLTPESIAQIDVPALLSYGGNSSCLPTCHGLEATLKQHRKILHPGLGHFFPMVEPKLVVTDLQQFLLAGPDGAKNSRIARSLDIDCRPVAPSPGHAVNQ